MPLPSFLKKASSFILGAQSGIPAPPFNEGEVVFCKNNVCVHPPTLLRQDCDVVHHPGYMTVTCQQSTDINKLTLHLSWIPNSTLRRNPWAIEKRCSLLQSGEDQSDVLSTCRISPSNGNNTPLSHIFHYPQPLPENYEAHCNCRGAPHSLDNSGVGNIFCMFNNHCTFQCSKNTFKNRTFWGKDENSELQKSSDKNHDNLSSLSSLEICEDIQAENHLRQIHLDGSLEVHGNSKGIEECSETERPSSLSCNREGIKNTTKHMEENELELKTPVTIQDSSLTSSLSGPTISVDESKTQVSPSPSVSSTCSLAVPLSFLGAGTDDIPTWMSSPEMLALQHNLTFPESATASPVVRRTHKCRRFSVDLSQMRSLRLFFNDPACTCGQLVVASRESQYKILHFHHGGLDHLAKVLQEWNFLLHSPQPSGDDHLPYRHFMVCRPEVGQDELHPEEGLVPPVGRDMWINLLNEEGQLEDDLTLRKGIFFGGLQPEMRSTVWPFLLHCFTFQSTYEDREQIVAIRRQEYHEITRRRLEMDGESKENFWRNIQCVVEKDVIRTDRGNPYFAGDDNPHVEDMKNILLNYAVYNPKFGYTQGMSDLLAPVLAEIQNESDAFWCFVGLMQKAIFVCTPTDNDMDRNLNYLRELIHLMVPDFYAHLQRHADAMELLFCHRWILLCFKREFPEPVALKMWEACWANYLTDYFHLFLCLAIVCIYSDDVIAQDLRTDEMLLHFSSLAMYMDGELILRKARGLLHQFRQMPRIPCTLGSLCQLCGPGMWDSTHAPVIECSGTHGRDPCPHRGVVLQQ
ncbi:hypothetical protein R5R35_013084 [Gryllus longicercus]|uniref:Rab-GAP TBC domain-containing protein n=1 Tax=Gryllus longicercus TaxID=2509291 RepID=A0AAN9YXS9_9ORTH